MDRVSRVVECGGCACVSALSLFVAKCGALSELLLLHFVLSIVVDAAQLIRVDLPLLPTISVSGDDALLACESFILSGM